MSERSPTASVSPRTSIPCGSSWLPVAVLSTGLPALGILAQPEIPEELDFSEIFDWVIIAILIISWLLPVLIGLAKKLREEEGEGFEKGEETALPKGSEPIEPS